MQRGTSTLTRNDPAQYDELHDEWWRPFGKFAALQWIAKARSVTVPIAPHPGAVLLDVACGAGLLAPWLDARGDGWRHVGLDLSTAALVQAREHGVIPVRGNVMHLPFATGSLNCVVAGEILEHVPDLDGFCAELARVLSPGGVLVIDTIADTLAARICLVRIAERLPGGPPRGCHDPDLLVHPDRLRAALAANGLHVTAMNGLRPSVLDYFPWLLRRRPAVRMLRIRSLAGVYQALALKETRPS